VSEAEHPERVARRTTPDAVTVEDVRQLMGAATPHFALQLRNRIRALIAGLPEDHPARALGEREIARLQELGIHGETRGEGLADGEEPLASLDLDGARAEQQAG
jgi:hypothetical protein